MKLKTEPFIKVGIFAAAQFHFTLEGAFGGCHTGQSDTTGNFIAKLSDNTIELWQNDVKVASRSSFMLEPFSPEESMFYLNDVTIGVNFHWQRTEEQCFKGALNLVIVDDKIQVINVIELESYLESVISSEMRPSASLSFLKAHAVISRGWLLSQLNRDKKAAVESDNSTSENEIIRWYDSEDHAHFDVCADDHCQRYQGISKIKSLNASKAVSETRGEVLMHNGEICDARYSKCCGGVSEVFSTCWEDKEVPYLVPVFDNIDEENPKKYRVENEEDTERWIYDVPEAFCNTDDPRILIQVLNEYDQETRDFFRWRRDIKQDWLQKKITQAFAIDLGYIRELIPFKRGTSGRISKLKIVGSKGELVLGKELEIRKLLSETHLYSSAFIVEPVEGRDGIPSVFILKGSGWGHGVGLCQIGAAVMGVQGYEYHEILKHYFKHTTIEKYFA